MRMSKTQKFGLQGELWVKEELEARGYGVQLISNWFDDYDLIVNGCLPVEVKTARSYIRKPSPTRAVLSYQFETARLPQIGDFLVVLVVNDQHGRMWPYVTPSWRYFQRSSVAITSHPTQYSGMWAKYLDRWSVVDRLIFARQYYGQKLQLPLFN